MAPHPETGESGFWICRTAAEDYLDLGTRVVPMYKRVVAEQGNALAVRDSTLANRALVIQSLRLQLDSERSLTENAREMMRIERGLREDFERAWARERRMRRIFMSSAVAAAAGIFILSK